MVDYYRILGVFPQASAKEIKSAYRRLVKEYHPDVVKDDPMLAQKIYEIQAAYEVLGEEEKRSRYDNERAGLAYGNHTGRKQTDRKQPDRKPAGLERSEPERGSKNPANGSQFEQFFGFQPGKGMETYSDNRQTVRMAENSMKPEGPMKPKDSIKPEGPMKPEEKFAALFRSRK